MLIPYASEPTEQTVPPPTRCVAVLFPSVLPKCLIPQLVGRSYVSYEEVARVNMNDDERCVLQVGNPRKGQTCRRARYSFTHDTVYAYSKLCSTRVSILVLALQKIFVVCFPPIVLLCLCVCRRIINHILCKYSEYLHASPSANRTTSQEKEELK